MRCVICHRPLTKATATISSRSGAMDFGPDCARRAGLTPAAAKRRAAIVRTKPAPRPDENQLDLFGAPCTTI